MNKEILDVCCGGKMFYPDKKENRVLFCDKRTEPRQKLSNGSWFEVSPDIIADFTKLPFENETFSLVIFDPPHLKCGEKSFLFKKYGTLYSDWKEVITSGFSECFRVLKPSGTLIFKWSENFRPLKEILELTPEKPVITHTTRSQSKMGFTHFCVFHKGVNHA